ncbi:MAG TPA: quinone oxidoreductase [Afipia sp.]|nr:MULTISPECIES: zinc-binding alcohol dehydrogenase family protein [unclassified Afipia]MAH68053.1 quinone oxidoreductase [Afipia sp.]OUX62893.1 MAG: quinone oxidoreductase [Afipia sp. TMED4]HAO40801.1 quinone oxidoreductase [Afipia sp.]HAP11937.1 quinone oxidoreductase [Afipia sp.]HAP47609.1 quinone oxidoreductase [Afipia sp.]
MRVIEAFEFTGYSGLRLVERENLAPSRDLVTVRLTAAGVNPLDHTVLSGGHPRAKPPAVFGNEGAGVVTHSGPSSLPVGARVMFTAPFGNGSWQEYVQIKAEELQPIPDGVDDVTATAAVVGYLSAYLTLQQAGFAAGKSVLAPAIGGAVGNATYQLARALGASKVVSTAGSKAKAEQARERGYDNVVDLSAESLAQGVRRLTDGAGIDVVIDAIGGTITSEALKAMAMGGSLVTLGYSAGRNTTIDVTDIIWKDLSVTGFSLFRSTRQEIQAAWDVISPLLVKGTVKPPVARIFPLEEAAKALQYLIEERPFGKVILKIAD